MGVKEWIIPQDQRFFDLLEGVTQHVAAGAEALSHLVRNYENVHEKRTELKRIETQGDDAVHAVIEALNRTFITPIDREDIMTLASDLDNVLDMTYASGLRLDLYEVAKPTPPMEELTDIIVDAVGKLREAVGLIRNMKNGTRVEQLAVEVNELENVADDVLNDAVAELFKTGDPVRIIKLKEIYENMEAATDACEDVANILSDIVAKNR